MKGRGCSCVFKLANAGQADVCLSREWTQRSGDQMNPLASDPANQRIELFALINDSVEDHLEHLLGLCGKSIVVVDTQLLSTRAAPFFQILGKHPFDFNATLHEVSHHVMHFVISLRQQFSVDMLVLQLKVLIDLVYIFEKKIAGYRRIAEQTVR